MPGPKSKRITPRNFIPQGRLKSLVWHSRTQDPSIEDPHVAAPSTHHPFNFDPCQLNKDVTHTAPYMTTITKRRLRPTDGNPEVRDMTDCRPHRQGSLHDILGNTAPVWTSIPGYGLGYSTANEYAEVAQDKRRRPTENGFRQSTASFTIRCPQGTWQDQAYKHWTPATHGMTHQEGPPYGNGTEFRQRLRVGEQMKLNESEERHANATHEVTTWAANKPSETRGHNGWRRGIKGYGGWKPKWKEDKDLFYQPQLGKVYPPYYPEVTRYSTILQPDETPRDLNIIQAVRSARSSASSASARNK
eukprot:g9119.t1